MAVTTYSFYFLFWLPKSWSQVGFEEKGERQVLEEVGQRDAQEVA